jgi:hypothetical protein
MFLFGQLSNQCGLFGYRGKSSCFSSGNGSRRKNNMPGPACKNSQITPTKKRKNSQIQLPKNCIAAFLPAQTLSILGSNTEKNRMTRSGR